MSAEMAVVSVMLMQCVPTLQAVIHAPVKLVLLEMDSPALYYNSMNFVTLDINSGVECVWVSH